MQIQQIGAERVIALNGEEVVLPKLAASATVNVWQHADSRCCLYVQKNGEPEEIPATKGWIKLSVLELPAAEGVHAADARMQEIKARLYEIDMCSVRPVRAWIAGLSSAEDKARLEVLEMESVGLRSELAEL